VSRAPITEVAKPAAKRRKNRKWSAAMKQSARLVQESKESLVRSFMQLPLDIVLEVSLQLNHLNASAIELIPSTVLVDVLSPTPSHTSRYQPH
jgi:hypothetical protein